MSAVLWKSATTWTYGARLCKTRQIAACACIPARHLRSIWKPLSSIVMTVGTYGHLIPDQHEHHVAELDQIVRA